MNIGELKSLLKQFDNDDLVVLSTGKEDVEGNSFYPLERAMASKLKPDNGDDIICAVFWPAINEV